MAITARFLAGAGLLTVSGDELDNPITIGRDVAGSIFVNDGVIPVDGGTPTIGNTSLIQVLGADGDDQVFGGGGNDRIVWNAGDGNDVVNGGFGLDTLEVNGGDGAETINITAHFSSIGVDIFDPSPSSISAGSIENLIVNGGGGDD